jgi:hypothetical protein
MRSWLQGLRRLSGTNDRDEAYREEQAALVRATANPGIDLRFRGDMEGLSRSQEAIPLGTAFKDRGIPVSLSPSDVMGTGHGLILGGNGTGKTRVAAGIVRELLRRIAHRPDSMGLWIIDHKSEFVPLVQDLLAQVIATLPPRAANALVDRIAVFNPFSSDALVPLQVLAPEPGVSPEVQAFEVTSLIDRLGGAELGVRQDSFLFHLLFMGITLGMSLPDVARALADPGELTRLARNSSSPEVRAYFSGAARVAASSLEGVRARLHRLLRLPATRLMLGARSSVNFRALLASKIVLADLGSPPMGCEDLGRFWAALVALKTTRAIFERSHAAARRPVAIMIDEWQEALAGGGDIAENYERILSMARSRGVSLWLISQSLAIAARISSSLPKVVATNTNVQCLFRASIEDARALAHLLPVTGRRPRGPAPPWEERSRSPYLGPAEELQRLVAEAAALPNRTFYLWRRAKNYPAHLVRAANVDIERPPPGGGQHRRIHEGSIAVPITELERDARGRAENVFRILPDDPEPITPTRRRPTFG